MVALAPPPQTHGHGCPHRHAAIACLRIGIAAIVQTQDDLTVSGQAGSVQEAIELFEQSAPDLVLMDLRLPDDNGVQAIKHMRAKQPSLKILVLTTYKGDEDIFQALQAGAMDT